MEHINVQWQLWPKCFGNKKNCHVCAGTGVLNSQTGLPPNKQLSVQNTNTSGEAQLFELK